MQNLIKKDSFEILILFIEMRKPLLQTKKYINISIIFSRDQFTW